MDSRVLFFVCCAVFSQAFSAAVDNSAANPEVESANNEQLTNSEYREPEQAGGVPVSEEVGQESADYTRPVRSPYYGGGYYGGGYPGYYGGYSRGYYGGYPSYRYGHYGGYGGYGHHGYGGYPYYGGYGHHRYY